MIENKLDELFSAIESSNEYQAYLNIGKVLENDEEINSLVTEIKELQQKSVRLEEQGNQEYKEIDKLIDSIECINDLRKKFYKRMYRERYEKILKPAYDRLVN